MLSGGTCARQGGLRAPAHRHTAGARVFDITSTAAATASEISYANVFEGLTIIDGQGQIKPRLAQSWTVSKDGKQVDVVLRRNVRYHDGKPFNASTAAFSLQRLLQMKNTNAYLEWFDKLASVEAREEFCCAST